MGNVVGALTNSTSGLTAGTFFSQIEALVPWLVFMIPIAVGIYFLRRSVKGAGKAKVRL